MGHYINPTNRGFKLSANSENYIDKTEFIQSTNEIIDTDHRYLCITRPPGFGKTMVANMLNAYYGDSDDGKQIFKNLAISNHKSFEKHINKYNTLYLNMQEFLFKTYSMNELLHLIDEKLLDEIFSAHTSVNVQNEDDLIDCFKDIYSVTKKPFVIIIDNWDCPLARYTDVEEQFKYLDFLALLLKDQPYVALAYLTGIMPMKKFGMHPSLNIFTQNSVVNPNKLSKYFGFSEDEIAALSVDYNVDSNKLKIWYGGYLGSGASVNCNPASVMCAIRHDEFANYATNAESFIELKNYLKPDLKGLRKKILLMTRDNPVAVQSSAFSKNINNVTTADDIFSVLVHLGYLTFDKKNLVVRIPNKEINGEIISVIKTLDWTVNKIKVKNPRIKEKIIEENEIPNEMTPQEAETGSCLAESLFEDPLIRDVLDFAFGQQKISSSILQRRFKIGYNRAARMVDALADAHLVGESDGSRGRAVLMDEKRYEELTAVSIIDKLNDKLSNQNLIVDGSEPVAEIEEI